jgi:transposase
MVVVGADVHKRTHTFVAVDEVGKQLAEFTVRADSKGHAKAVQWARQMFPGERRWGIEDCRHLSARLERDLLTGGEQVVRVPPKLMAQTRASARTRGKSDPIDALAVARAVLREPDLPVAAHDGVSRELKLLVDRREDLVGERTRMINRFRWHLHELDPHLDPSKASLDRAKTRAALAEQLNRFDGLVGELACGILADIDRITQIINELERRISHRVEEQGDALIGLPGCAALTAAKIIGETAGVARFRSEACYARHAGVAPIPVWSATVLAASGCPEPGTGSSMPPCTGLRSLRSASTVRGAATTASAYWPATPRPKPSGASNAAWPASSSAPCTPSTTVVPACNRQRLDIGETHGCDHGAHRREHR